MIEISIFYSNRAEVYRRPKVYGRSRRFLTYGYGFGCRSSKGPKAKNFSKIRPKILESLAKTLVNSFENFFSEATFFSFWFPLLHETWINQGCVSIITISIFIFNTNECKFIPRLQVSDSKPSMGQALGKD